MASGSNKRKLPAMISVRVSRQLRSALDRIARERDQSAASFLREMAVKAARIEKRDDVFRSPPRRPIVIPSDDLKTVAMLTNRLAVVGGSVVQMCKTMRESAHPAHAAAEETLSEIRSIQRDLVDVVRILKSEVSR